MLEPWGERPAHLRAGIVAATIANVNRSKKSRTFKPEDFMPQEIDFSKPVKQGVEEQKQAVMGMAKFFEKQGRLVRKKRE